LYHQRYKEPTDGLATAFLVPEMLSKCFQKRILKKRVKWEQYLFIFKPSPTIKYQWKYFRRPSSNIKLLLPSHQKWQLHHSDVWKFRGKNYLQYWHVVSEATSRFHDLIL
jgi:hypothetical protein